MGEPSGRVDDMTTWFARQDLTIGEPYDHILITGPLPVSLLPLQRWARLAETRTSSFECRGVRRSSNT